MSVSPSCQPCITIKHQLYDQLCLTCAIFTEISELLSGENNMEIVNYMHQKKKKNTIKKFIENYASQSYNT